MRNLILSISILLITFVVSAQPSDDKPVNPIIVKYHKDHFNFKGPVKKVVVYNRGIKTGSISDIVNNQSFYEKKKPKTYYYRLDKTYFFDRNGYLLSVVYKDDDVDKYRYNEKNQLDGMTRTIYDGAKNIYFNYSSDRSGNVIKSNNDAFGYNEKNQLIEYFKDVARDGKGARQATYYVYNEAGQLIEEKKQTARSITTTTYTYELIKSGQWLVKLNRKTNWGSSESETIYSNGLVATERRGTENELKYKIVLDKYDNVTLYNDEIDKDSHVSSDFKREFQYW